MGLDQAQFLRRQLERQILARCGHRILNLCVEVGPDQVVLHGRTDRFHVKQLAQHGVRELLPTVPLRNAITVEKLAV
jgi:hypothetical protein